jgi:hypothetical protein
VARLIRNSEIPASPFELQPLPQLEGLTLERYTACVGKRVGDFPENKSLDYRIPTKTVIKQYSHRLSYDAESILWLLLWWAIQAQPEGGQENPIAADDWVDLTAGPGQRDKRHTFVDRFSKVCHPSYGPLDNLLESLFSQLKGYQEYVALSDMPNRPKDPLREKPEYLHEAFQRIILDFIVKNSDKPFMNLPIGSSRRPVSNDTVSQDRTTPRTGSRRTVSARDLEDTVEGGGWLERGETEDTVAESPSKKTKR